METQKEWKKSEMNELEEMTERNERRTQAYWWFVDEFSPVENLQRVVHFARFA